MTGMERGAPIDAPKTTKNFFETTLDLLAENKLKEFENGWDNPTEFTLKQLVGLYRYERERADNQDLWTTMAAMFLAMACVSGIGVSIFLLKGGFSTAGVTASLVLCFGAAAVLNSLFNRLSQRKFEASNGPVYEAELRRFSDTLEAALKPLNLTLDDVLKLGRQKIVQLASEEIDRWARDVEHRIYLRREAESIETARMYGDELVKVNNWFDQYYEAFVALKLEKRGRGTILETARRELEAARVREHAAVE